MEMHPILALKVATPRLWRQQGWFLQGPHSLVASAGLISSRASLFGFRQLQLLLCLLVVVSWHVSCVLTPSYSHTGHLELGLTLMTLFHSVTSLKTCLQIQLHSEVLGIRILIYDFIFGYEISLNVLGTF